MKICSDIKTAILIAYEVDTQNHIAVANAQKFDTHQRIYYYKAKEQFAIGSSQEVVPDGFVKMSLNQIVTKVSLFKGEAFDLYKPMYYMADRKNLKAYPITCCGIFRVAFSCVQNFFSGYGFATSSKRAYNLASMLIHQKMDYEL